MALVFLEMQRSTLDSLCIIYPPVRHDSHRPLCVPTAVFVLVDQCYLHSSSSRAAGPSIGFTKASGQLEFHTELRSLSGNAEHRDARAVIADHGLHDCQA